MSAFAESREIKSLLESDLYKPIGEDGGYAQVWESPGGQVVRWVVTGGRVRAEVLNPDRSSRATSDDASAAWLAEVLP